MQTHTITRWMFALLLVAAWAALAPPGCGTRDAEQPPEPGTDAPLRIIATTGMVGDVVRAVVGERGTVEDLISPGVDPHLYKPTRTDVSRLLEADAIFYNGLLLEGKLIDSLIRAATAGKPVHAVTESLDPELLLSPDDLEGHEDPHLWMDPRTWASTVNVVRNHLSELDPDGAMLYNDNAAAYRQRLESLDAYAGRVLATVPERSRVLVTAHDAFNYFGRRYGFEVVGIQGISTESEAGVRDIERLVDLLVEREISAVFIESTVSARNVDAVIAGARARGHTVVIGGELFSDAMGAQGTPEGTYIGMIEHNVTTIARALGGTVSDGDAPATGGAGASP